MLGVCISYKYTTGPFRVMFVNSVIGFVDTWATFIVW